MRRTLSVCLSVSPVIDGHVFSAPLASRMYFSARTEGIHTFRHALRAAYRTAISAAQILVIIYIVLILPVHTAVKDLDLDLKLVHLDLTCTWLLLDFIQVCLESKYLQFSGLSD